MHCECEQPQWHDKPSGRVVCLNCGLPKAVKQPPKKERP